MPAAASAHAHPHPTRGQLLAAFAAVYVIWGSTYLAIRFAVQTLPPFLMGGVRFLVAGAVLYVWARVRGTSAPSRSAWRTAAIAGGFLLLGGNGAVVWAEQRVPSGITALLVATLPVWMVLLDWLRPGGTRPRIGVFAGLALGLGGLALLVGPDVGSGGDAVDLVGAGVLVLGSMSWATGSLYLRHAPRAESATIANAMQMLAGGAGLAILGVASGEVGRLDVGHASTRSVLALLYLIGFGSLVGFTAYTFLLTAASPAKVSTYAYVNPVVAVFLGWAMAGEPITTRTLLAAAVILAGVATLTLVGGERPRRDLPDDSAEPAGAESPPADETPARRAASG